MRNFFVKTKQFVKKYLTIFIIAFIFLFLFICDNLHVSSGNKIMQNLKSIATSFTPTTDLFDDGSEVSFVSYFFGMVAPTKEDKADFYHPTTNQNLSTTDDFLSYNYDGLISSICDGVVIAVGYTTNNEKYVEIQHAEGYVSRYVGLFSLGVATGEGINAGNPVGVVKLGQNVKIYLHKNGNLVKISEVEWKK